MEYKSFSISSSLFSHLFRTRYHDGFEIGIARVGGNHFGISLRGEHLDPLEEVFVPAHHDDFCGKGDGRLRFQYGEVTRLMIGLEEYGLEVDVPGIRIEKHAGLLRGRIDMLCHVFESRAERAVLLRIVCEEREIFHGIPKCARPDDDDDEGEKDDTTTALVLLREFEEKEYGEGREEKDGNLGTDGSESMGEALIRQVFRGEHDEEDDEEEGIAREVGMVFPGAQTQAEESPGLTEKEKESGEKAGADDGVEDGIGRVIVAEILIADEIVLDEGESERFPESTPDITVVYFL